MNEDNKKEFKFTLGIFDELSENIIDKIRNEANDSNIYGVGIYTDKYVIDQYMTCPRNTLEERMECVQKLNDVDFVFPVDTSDPSKVSKIIEKAYDKYMYSK